MAATVLSCGHHIIVHKYAAELTKAFSTHNLGSISNKLLSKGIISKESHDRVTKDTGGTEEKEKVLVSCLIQHVQQKPETFQEFLKFLEEEASFKEVAGKLKEACSQLPQYNGSQTKPSPAQSDQVTAAYDGVVEMPCLGRPFRVGMFYDCRNDNLLLGIRLCKDDVIEAVVEEQSQVSYSCEVIEDDRFETKASSLQLTTPLKLSLMSNLLHDNSKSAKYWNDRCKSKRQVRVCLKYASTTSKKLLPLNNLGETQHQIFDRATHVVTGVLYGWDAYCVFDHVLRENERFEDVHKNLVTLVETLSSSGNTHDDHTASSHCKVYSDFEQTHSFQEVVEQFEKLQSLSDDKKPAPVSKKVWLYPLKKLDSKCNVFARQVSTDTVNQLESILEYLHGIEIVSNDLLNEHSVTLNVFVHTESVVTKFTEVVANYSNDLRKRIAKMLPSVRGGSVDEHEITKVIKENSASPFKLESLNAWLEQVKEEMGALEMLMSQVEGVEFISSRELESTSSHEFDSDYLACFAFHIALEEDKFVSFLQSYLQSDQVHQHVGEMQKPSKWYTNTKIMKELSSNIEHFKAFMKSCTSTSERKNIRFMLTSCPPSTSLASNEPSSVLLYEGSTCKVWEPPGPPGKPIVKEVTHNSIQLEWSKPTYGSKSVECYQVSYHPVDNPQCSKVVTTNTTQGVATINELVAGTKYVFTVQSKCKVGVGSKGEASDSIETKAALPVVNGTKIQNGTSADTTSVKSEHHLSSPTPIQTSSNKAAATITAHSQETLQNKPIATAVTQNTITLEWTTPKDNNDVDYYIISYRLVESASKKWKKVMTDSSEPKKVVTGLSPQTKYVFKVRPELEDGVGIESEVSDPIETKAPLCQPGKPTAIAVSHDSITLQWDEPPYDRENVESYVVSYQSLTDPRKKWKKTMTDNAERKHVVSKLTPNTKYIFKVRPELEEGATGVESEVSDPIKTKAQTTTSTVGAPPPPSTTTTTTTMGKPTATAVTHNSITLQWTKPEHGGETVETYLVCYRPVDNPSNRWTKKMTDGDKEDITLTGLSPKTKYIVKVRPEFESGPGVDSEISEPIETKKSFSHFDKPRASFVTNNSVQLKLTKLENGTEAAERYTVCYRLVDNSGSKWTQKTFNTVQEHVTVEDLNQNAKYVFKIFSSDASENGPESEVSDPIQTKSISSPGKPIVTTVTHDSITVKWSKPKHSTSNVKSYSVHCSPIKKGSEKQRISVTCEEATISSLKPLETYIVVVKPICKSGVGTESEPSEPIMTKATSPPGKPVATKVTCNSVSLEWKAPDYCCEKIESYTVCYQSSHNSPDQWNVKQSRSTKFAISGLNYNTEYVFKVHANCKSGSTGSESQLSKPVKTKSASPPGKPIASAVTHNSVKLCWSKPELGSKDGSNYHISFLKGNQTEKWELRKTSSPSTEVVLNHLDPDTEYVFKVKLLCQTGESDESEISNPIKTKPVCKPGKPYATNVTEDSICLVWETPRHNRSTVDTYSIVPGSKDTNGISDFVQTVNAQSHSFERQSYTLCNLKPGTTYTFKVVPTGHLKDHSVYVPSELSDPIVTKVTSSPGEPTAEDITNDTITIKWTRPTYGKEYIKHYSVCYRSVTDLPNEWKHQNTAGPQTRQIITGLSMKTKYTFAVIPKCKDGMEGSESVPSSPIETLATSPPGIPEATEVTHEMMSLKWTPPDCGAENVKSYIVCFRQLEHDKWRTQTIANDSTFIIIRGLETHKHYVFKVIAECKQGCGTGAESKVSGPISTSKCCKPGKPTASIVTHNSISLSWSKPIYGYDSIQRYDVSCRQGRYTGAWSQIFLDGRNESILITALLPNTEYTFKVKPVLCPGIDMHTAFSTSDYIKTDDKPLADRVLDMCSRADQIVPPGSDGPNGMVVYRVPKRQQDMKNTTKRIAKYHYGTPRDGVHERVIMLVGATGAGKSTLINSIANYILGVSWETQFRFKLIEDEKASQAHSQTSWITAYTFHAQKGSPVRYDLTIVDTPGFGDTRGIERDKEITKHIKEFFSVKPPNGIDAIHAIGFVAQAALARLTPTQKYVFDSILAMFGKDVADNIFLMSTFADGQPPQVLAAIKEANIKCNSCFKFNNSVLYTSTGAGGQFGQLFWEMNEGSIKSFFRILENTKAISLQLTKEVLQKREHLEILIQGLQEKVRMGLHLIQEVQQEQKIIENYKADVFDPNFTYEVDVPKTRQVPLPEGKYVTNCMQCNFTCHYPCTIADDGKKYNCAAMGGWWIFRGQDSKCENCPRKCHWSEHKQNGFRIEIYQDKETRTLKDLLERYLESSESEDDDNLTVTDKLKSNAASRLKTLNKDVMDLIRKTQRCLRRLQEIAYKRHPLNELAYIELMIESEKREAKEGFQGRISALEGLKEQAGLLSQLDHSQESDKETPLSSGSQEWWNLACIPGMCAKTTD